MKRPLEYKKHGHRLTRILNWCFAKVEGEQLPCIKGKHYGHSKSKAGEPITTAIIRDFYHGGYSLRIICEDGTEYKLGEIDPEYKEKYPDIIKNTRAFYAKLNN